MEHERIHETSLQMQMSCYRSQACFVKTLGVVGKPKGRTFH